MHTLLTMMELDELMHCEYVGDHNAHVIARDVHEEAELVRLYDPYTGECRDDGDTLVGDDLFIPGLAYGYV